MNYRTETNKPIRADLIKIIDLANEKLKYRPQYRGRYVVHVNLYEIKELVGKESVRETIVEAVKRLDHIIFEACGSWLGLFKSVSYNGIDLELEYWPKAASVIKAMMMEDYE